LPAEAIKPFHLLPCLCLVLLLGGFAVSAVGADGRETGAPGLLLIAGNSWRPADIAVVVNINNPDSVEIGDYYRRARGLAENQLIEVDLPNAANISREVFAAAFADVERQLPPGIKGFALAWTKPYRVDCLSITTAFATGFDERYCPQPEPGERCAPSGESPFFGISRKRPVAPRELRPAMLLAASSVADAKALIDRGVASDGSFPPGTAYLLSTSDKARTVRDQKFELVEQVLSPYLAIEVLEQDVLRDRDDVLFYFTGKARVAGLDTLGFVPGAVADHLTSFGGRMLAPGEGKQMSALRWLDAGATGSYGTVTEPCNFPQKFSDPGLLMTAYRQGDTLIEAYWRSVAWPGQGLFIGEPLAAPFRLSSLRFDGDSLQLPAGRIRPGKYRLEASAFAAGPFRDTGRVVEIRRGQATVALNGLVQRFYRLRIKGV
jgi:uncharacterized protein (TIGR03790 family)